jgi:hypothetical protein
LLNFFDIDDCPTKANDVAQIPRNTPSSFDGPKQYIVENITHAPMKNLSQSNNQ